MRVAGDYKENEGIAQSPTADYHGHIGDTSCAGTECDLGMTPFSIGILNAQSKKISARQIVATNGKYT
jgi:hypothetical protein